MRKWFDKICTNHVDYNDLLLETKGKINRKNFIPLSLISGRFNKIVVVCGSDILKTFLIVFHFFGLDEGVVRITFSGSVPHSAQTLRRTYANELFGV